MTGTVSLSRFKGEGPFIRRDFMLEMGKQFPQLSEASYKAKMQQVLSTGEIVRVARNTYRVDNAQRGCYSHRYSDFASTVAAQIKGKHPFLDFRIFELVQLNDFLNHQLAHNVVFLSVESDLGYFVFETLKGLYPGKVLLTPTLEMFHQYWCEDMIVIEKLPTETLRGRKETRQTDLEKMLVDLMSDKLIPSCFSESELPAIYEEAFHRYVIDESRMFRYAKRRTADKRLQQFLSEQTDVSLQVKG